MRKSVAWSALWLSTVSATVIGSGCLRVGEPAPDELAARDAWSKMVSDQERAQVEREASTHTEWMEKKRINWETQQYKSKYSHAQAKKAAKAATTRSATQATTNATTSPFGGL